MKHIKNNLVPVCIFLLAVISFYFADVSGKYLASEIYTRFIRNALFVLALILPISCGMGINFAIVVGAISAQMAIVFAIDLMLEGPAALLFTMSVSIFLSIVFGLMVAALLNRAKGREMIVSIMLLKSKYQNPIAKQNLNITPSIMDEIKSDIFTIC